MKRHNIFATPEEVTELKDLLRTAQNTPAITLSHLTQDFATSAWEHVKKRCHALAMAHGLPEIVGYYGCDLENGEFVSY